MGKGSSSPQTVTNVTRNEPDPLTQQWRSQLFNLAQNEYNQGQPAQFPGSTVVPFSDQTQSGLNYMQDYASQGAFGLPQAQGSLNRSMSGWNPAMPFATNAAAGGLYNPVQNARTTAGIDTLQQTARGDMIGQNPYTQRLANQVTDGVNANFARAGRYGSNAHAEGIASGLSDLYGGLYQGERQNQLAAANQLAGYNAADLSRMGSLYDSGFGRMMDGASMLGDLYTTGNAQGMAAAAMLPSLYNYGLMPGQTMTQVGAQYENLAGDYLNDARNRFNYDQNANRSNISWLADMMNGLPTFGTTTSTQTQSAPRRSGLLGGLGGAATGAGIWSGLLNAGVGISNPLGWGMVGLGGLAGMFG